MVKLGVLLIILSVVLLLVMLFAPNIMSPLAPLLCPKGDTLTSESDTYYPRPGETDTTISYFCTKYDGVAQSDVSGQMTAITMGIFFVVLFGGIALTTIGGSRNTRNLASSWGQPGMSSSSGASSRFSTNRATSGDTLAGIQQGVIRFGGQDFHVDDLKSGNYQLGDANKRTLADTLRQLDDAHTQGLITDDEHQKLRGEALDKLV